MATQDPSHIMGLSDGQPQGPLPEQTCPPVQALAPPPVQAPLELQLPGTLAVVLFMHPVEPQEVVLPGNVQAELVPSHEPAQGGDPPQGVRAVLTFAHVPVEQDWH